MDDLPEYDEHDRSDGATGCCGEGAEKGEDGDGESCPAGVNAKGSDKDGDKTGACTWYNDQSYEKSNIRLA